MFKVKTCKLLLILAVFVSSLVLFNKVFAECLQGQININQAPADNLDKITQIGPVTVEKIIAERNISLFTSLDDLLRVSGIGETTLTKIKQEGLACVSSTSSPQVPSTSTSTDSSTATTTSETGSISTATSTSQTSGGSANQRPIAEAGQDIVTNVATTVHFDGSQSFDPDHDELVYFWNFGDGNSKEGTSIDHFYELSGKYVVSLEVGDGKSTSIDTLIVNVYPQAIFISEFLPDPLTEEEKNEWIEIGNFSSYLADISGWEIADEGTSSHRFIFPKNTLVLPNTFLVLPRPLTKITLNNDKDKIRLSYPSGELADEVSYEKPKLGMSAARKDEKFFWTLVPTPGFSNIIYLDEKNTNKTSILDKKVEDSVLSNSKNQVIIFASTVASKKVSSKVVLGADFKKQVNIPTTADIDNIFEIKKVLADEGIILPKSISNKLEKNSQRDIKLTSNSGVFKKTIFQKPQIILFVSTIISSILFAFWGIEIKRRFFK
ncbi:MAG: PKD domain-containing protein [Candidatus Paceibacterota bacterium]|jgi:hypothetical protein